MMVNLPMRGNCFAFPPPNPLTSPPIIPRIKTPIPKIGINIHPITGIMPSITLPTIPVIKSSNACDWHEILHIWIQDRQSAAGRRADRQALPWFYFFSMSSGGIGVFLSRSQLLVFVFFVLSSYSPPNL